MVIHAGEIHTCVLFQEDIRQCGNNELYTTKPLKAGDFVELDMHVESTYEGGEQYIPIVCKNEYKPVSSTGGHIMESINSKVGQIISDPRWFCIPVDDVHDWKVMLKHGYFQIAVVQFFKSVFVSTNGRYILMEDYINNIKALPDKLEAEHQAQIAFVKE